MLNKDALAIAQETKNQRELVNCLNNIGIYFIKLENYADSLGYFEQALGVAKECDDVQGETYSLTNLGIIYQELGDYEKALDCISKSLIIDNELKDDAQTSIDYLNRGIVFRRRGLISNNKEDFDRAYADFALSLGLAQKSKDQRVEIAALNNIGSLLTDREQYREALVRFEEAYDLAQGIHDNEKVSRILNNLGIISFKLGNVDKATNYYKEAINIASENQDAQILWESHLEYANAYAKQNKYADAIRNYEKSISIIEGVRSSINIEDLKASYLGTDKRLEAYQNLIDLLVTLHRTTPGKGYDEEAFNYLERAKARAFLDSLEVAQVDISEGINPVLANREKEIMRDISRSYNKLLVPGLSAEGRDSISSQIKTGEDRLESLKREIRMSSPAYADLRYPEVVTYDEVHQSLSTSDVAYFAYSVGKEASHAFVITSRGLKTFKLPARPILQQQVAAYRKAISDRTNRDFHLGQELFQELVSPGLESGLKKIVIVPDDILNLLPFETLLTSKEPDSWLVRDYMVGYTPSLSSLRVLMQRHQNGPRPRKDLLAIGNPVYGSSSGPENGNTLSPAVLYNFNSSSGISLPALKYSGLEIENIAHLFRQNKVTVLEKENATERWLKSNPLADYKIIHFSAHSVIDDKKPTRSAIVLSYRQNLVGNGLLQTRDIYNLKLNADLVTLSACQTGLGQFIRGEGIEGLSRAFFYAGSSSVLMSLWSVNDQATYLLMERFYRHLKSSEPLMGALRNAKLEMIQSRTLSHPYYWAGFVINGRTDAQVFSRSRLLGVFLAGLLGVGIILVFSTAIRKQKRS
jgi:CHAT domain-containing protein